MNTKTNPARPLYRVTFSRITGTDDDGKDILAKPKEIGAVWPRKGGKQGGILVLDVIPTELAQRKGVLFLLPVGAGDAFTEDTDPYGEHDFGAFIDPDAGEFFWKIDYYDTDYLYGSPDPINPKVTRRVLTIMLADEY